MEQLGHKLEAIQNAGIPSGSTCSVTKLAPPKIRVSLSYVEADLSDSSGTVPVSIPYGIADGIISNEAVLICQTMRMN